MMVFSDSRKGYYLTWIIAIKSQTLEVIKKFPDPLDGSLGD